MNLLDPILPVMGGMTVWMTLAWITQGGARNGGWVDVFWTFGAGAACVTAALWPGPSEDTTRQIVVAGLAAIWSVRLGVYIGLRVAKDPREDRRYAGLRVEWGGDFQRNMFFLCIVQAPAAAILALSVFIAAHGGSGPFGLRDGLGIALLVVALLGEAIADDQMRRFRATASHGDVMDRGLWGWSRHPNYFFEWLVWLAYPVIAFDPEVAWSWASLAAPVMMFLLLRFGTGVPALEKTMLASRGDRFRDYQRRVSAFFPWPPRRA